MFGSRIKLDPALLTRAKRFADLAGYSSVDEFVAHVLEKERSGIEIENRVGAQRMADARPALAR